MRLCVISLLLLSSALGPASAQPSGPVSHDQPWLERFVARLDTLQNPMAEIRGLGQHPSKESIIATAAAWFRGKTVDDPLWVIPFPEARSPDHDDLLADKAVDHLLTTREGEEQFGETLPWFSPSKRLGTIARFPHFDYLAPAYYHTGDERYAQAMVRDMMDFVYHVPLSKSAGYHVQMDLRSNPWNWVLLQWRVKRWIDALAYLRDSPSLSDAQYLRIVLHLWEEVDWLLPRKVLGLHNGTLGNLSAILYAAIHFPEAARSRAWMQDAGAFFNAFLDTAFYPGEFLIELTLGYSEGTLVMCLSMLEGLPASPLRDEIVPKLEKIVDAHVGMMKPDRSLPRYGDHGIYDIRDRLLRKGGILFDRPDLIALADTENDPTVIPDRLSFPFASNPYYLSGYYAMRDGWGTDAQYLSMDAGPFGTNHHHGDKLSITVSADGAEFIVDPGTSLYRSLEPGPRIDLRPGFLHNVITIDGIDPNTGWDRHYGFDVLDNRWVTNPTYDFLEGIYEFRNNLLDVIWRRSVFFKKGEYWILIDALLGSGRHEVESNLQFMIDTQVDVSTPESVVARAPNGAQLALQTSPDAGLSPRIVIADTTFPGTTYLLQYPSFVDWVPGGRGWVGTFGNERRREAAHSHPAPAVVFSGTVTLPHYTVRVLSPSKRKEAVVREIKWIDRSTDRLFLQISRNGSDEVDYVDWKPAQRRDPRTKLDDDEGAWYRTVDGRVVEIILTNRSAIHIDVEGETIDVAFDQRFEGVISRSDTTWTVWADPYLRSPVHLDTFRVDDRNSGGRALRFDVRDAEAGNQLVPGRAVVLVDR